MDDNLKLMVDNYISDESFDESSIYWNALAQQHINYIVNHGIENFKQTILLSPAAASFDQFDNFESRGNYFKKLVLKKFKLKFNV